MVRDFIKAKGHADYYPNLKINFIAAAPPELVCFKAFRDGEVEMERISMEKMTIPECHKLVESKGYKRIMPADFAKRIEQGLAVIPEEEWDEYLAAIAKVDPKVLESKRRHEAKLVEQAQVRANIDAKMADRIAKLEAMQAASEEKKKQESAEL